MYVATTIEQAQELAAFMLDFANSYRAEQLTKN